MGDIRLRTNSKGKRLPGFVSAIVNANYIIDSANKMSSTLLQKGVFLFWGKRDASSIPFTPKTPQTEMHRYKIPHTLY
jgi:hypothetical protein